MNANHLRAILTQKEAGLSACECDGVQLSSNGHILVASDLVPMSGDPKDEAIRGKMSAMWKEFQSANWPELDPLTAVSEWPSDRTIKFFRRIGNGAINEAYFRTIHDSDVRWSWNGAHDKPFLAKVGGNLVAAVMGLRVDREGAGELLPYSPSDDLVFEQFADVGNDYYLQGDKVLLKEISDLRSELGQIRSRIANLEDDADEIESEISEKQSALDSRRLTASQGEVAHA